MRLAVFIERRCLWGGVAASELPERASVVEDEDTGRASIKYMADYEDH